jgi:chemotaxis protein MotB
MAKRRHGEEEHANHERWLVSYADFMTLLFAFFVVMYAVSRVDNARLVKVTQSIRFALHFKGTGGVGELQIFDGPVTDQGTMMGGGNSGGAGVGSAQPDLEAIRRRLERQLRPFLTEHDGNAAVSLVPEGKRLTVRMSANAFFDPSQTALRPEALPILDVIAHEVFALGRPVRVEGHTDLQPVSTERFRNNWELSAMRAATVVSYLEAAHHVDPRLLSASGCGAGRPVASNDTPQGRERNRRIDLVVELGPDDPAAAAAH